MIDVKTIYTIHNTQGELKFAIQPNVSDGPDGVQQNTDLTLYGNASLNWGERFNENFYHLMENFACLPEDDTIPAENQEPSKLASPIQGQLWFNTKEKQLYVYEYDEVTDTYKWRLLFDLNGKKIINLADPTNNQDAATKKYVDDAISGGSTGSFVLKSGDTMSGDLDMNSNEVIGLPTTPSTTTAAVSKAHLDNHAVKKSGDTMSGELAMGVGVDPNLFYRIINLADPINAQDAATKKYIDDAISGIGPSGDFVLKTGDTMTGNLSMTNGAEVLGLPPTPSLADAASSKAYVDSKVANLGDGIVAQSFTSPGYVRFANGYTIQWGHVNTGSSTYYTVPFPLTFTQLYSITLGPTSSGASPWINSSTLSSFVYADSTTYSTAYWIAMGVI